MEALNMILTMKFELALTLLLFVLLFLKIDGRANNVSIIRITNLFLLLNLAIIQSTKEILLSKPSANQKREKRLQKKLKRK